MRIVVFSDSHRNFAALNKIVLRHPEAEWFLHLGDGQEELGRLIDRYPDRAFRGVRGNNDWGSQARLTDVLAVGGVKIFLTHGHTFGVKMELDYLIQYAHNLRADIALFGHTHKAMTRYEDGLYLMNPGSVTHPFTGGPTYGTIDLTPAGIVTNIVPL